MNVLRRVLLAAYSIVLVAAAGGMVVLAWHQDQKLDLKVRHLNLQAFITSSSSEKWALILLMGLIVLFGLLSLVVAFIQGWSSDSDRSLRLHQTDGGTVEISASALEALLRDQLEALPLISRASPKVRLRAGAVESDITVTTDPGASIATVTVAVAETTARTFKELVGVSHVRRPHVRIQHEPGIVSGGEMAPLSPPPAETDPVAPAT
jgi:hypothetical protein